MRCSPASTALNGPKSTLSQQIGEHPRSLNILQRGRLLTPFKGKAMPGQSGGMAHTASSEPRARTDAAG